MARTRFGAGAGAALLLIAAVSAVSFAQEPFVDTPPPPGAICPSIELDYELCSQDLLSGNCPGFVSAAKALGRLYLFNVQREPARAAQLQASIWWGCGSKRLPELKAFLARLDSPEARAVLESEPYRSLPAPRPETQAASRALPEAPAAINCEKGRTAAERSACRSQQLVAARAEQQRTFEACKATLSGFLRSQLVTQEQAWRANLQIECASSDTRCLTAANRQRAAAIRSGFPPCAAPGQAPSVAANVASPAKTGMLPAQWTPPHGPTQPVPFSFERETIKMGTMSTTLGRGGHPFHGSYLLIEKSTEGHLVTAIYDGWSSPEWEMWNRDPDGQWTATGVSFGDFAAFYTGKVVATLGNDQGHSMRCQLRLKQPPAGLIGGGSGVCQVSDGGRIALEF